MLLPKPQCVKMTGFFLDETCNAYHNTLNCVFAAFRRLAMKTFAEVCEQIAATTKKLEKERILSEYLRTLNDKDLAIACTFLSGSPFALRDQRTLNTGFAAIRDALIELHPEVEAGLGHAL